MRSIFFITTTHEGGIIDRSLQIANTDYRVGIGGLAGLFYTSTLLRSVRAMSCELLWYPAAPHILLGALP
jgi:hypothetical protein